VVKRIVHLAVRDYLKRDRIRGPAAIWLNHKRGEERKGTSKGGAHRARKRKEVILHLKEKRSDHIIERVFFEKGKGDVRGFRRYLERRRNEKRHVEGGDKDILKEKSYYLFRKEGG